MSLLALRNYKKVKDVYKPIHWLSYGHQSSVESCPSHLFDSPVHSAEIVKVYNLNRTHNEHSSPEILFSSKLSIPNSPSESPIYISKIQRKIKAYYVREYTLKLFYHLKSGLIKRKQYQFTKFLIRNRIAKILNSWQYSSKFRRELKKTIQNLCLSRYFLAFRDVVKQYRKIRYSLWLKYQSLLLKYFKKLYQNYRKKSKAVAFHQLNQNYQLYRCFSSWKGYSICKIQIRYKSTILKKALMHFRTINVFHGLKIKVSHNQCYFIKNRQALRFDNLRLYRYFYSLLGIVSYLQLVRIKSIRLTNKIATARKNEFGKLFFKQIWYILKEGYYRRRQIGIKYVSRVFSAWKNRAVHNFVLRKQFELSEMYHKNYVQKGFFDYLKSMAYATLNKKVTCKNIVIFNRKLQFLNKLQQKPTYARKPTNSLLILFKQFGNRINLLKQIRLKDRYIRKKIRKLQYYLSKHRKSTMISLLNEQTKYKLSKQLLHHYCQYLYQKRLLQKYLFALKSF